MAKASNVETKGPGDCTLRWFNYRKKSHPKTTIGATKWHSYNG